MRCKRFVKALLSIMLVAVFVVQSSAFTVKTEAKTVAQWQQELADLKAEQAEIEKNLKGLKNDISEKEAYRKELQKQADNMQDQIDTCNAQIAQYQKEINAFEAQIADENAKIEGTKHLFKQRLRAIAMSGGDAASLTLLLNADNFGDLLAKSELARSVSAYDQAIIEKIKVTIEGIKASQASILEMQKSQAEMKAELASNQRSLNAQINTINDQINDIENDKDAYDDRIAELKKAAEEAEAYINKANGGSTTVFGGRFTWPVPGYSRISSPFGWRTDPFNSSESEYHKGIDIPAPKNVPVKAAADGTITIANIGWGGGYGNYITIKHGEFEGNSYVTLYAHMNSHASGIYPGVTVKKGQTIGYIGTTGSSTGNHLHFEVRVNGVVSNPEKYVSYGS